ncbi:hypothetical protein K438DRAFT_2000289 [Mycena galopus ATCC 62051]|nr:hypothetical protein K438DRAFT_2000289 [Mycena galopus ATCC 62051]
MRPAFRVSRLHFERGPPTSDVCHFATLTFDPVTNRLYSFEKASLPVHPQRRPARRTRLRPPNPRPSSSTPPTCSLPRSVEPSPALNAGPVPMPHDRRSHAHRVHAHTPPPLPLQSVLRCAAVSSHRPTSRPHLACAVPPRQSQRAYNQDLPRSLEAVLVTFDSTSTPCSPPPTTPARQHDTAYASSTPHSRVFAARLLGRPPATSPHPHSSLPVPPSDADLLEPGAGVFQHNGHSGTAAWLSSLVSSTAVQESGPSAHSYIALFHNIHEHTFRDAFHQNLFSLNFRI